MRSPSRGWKRFRVVVAVGVAGTIVAACSDDPGATTVTTGSSETATPRSSSTVGTDVETTAAPTVELPTVDGVGGAATVAAYDRLDLTVDLSAEYDNPYDQREIALDAVFTSPAGESMEVPGFWDGEGAWRLRFTPDEPGDWTYAVAVTDHRGTGDAIAGSFVVTPSDHPGFIRVGDDVDPEYSPRYFARDDGTPWFGYGHADLDMNWGGFAGETFSKMTQMAETGENFEMWWPQWTSNMLQNAHDDYNAAAMNRVDFVLAEAERNDIAVAFTVWIHQHLRTKDHAWGTGEWERNGFTKLVDRPEDFFVDPEAWAWQENYYRYVIARWSYSPAIAMWQTITEVNGTNSYEQTDPWHARVNEYFQTNDPFRHPTTATGSGGYWWPAAFEVMDVLQMHVYEQFHANPIEAGQIMADWTTAMWEYQEKPNWIGEYGDRRPAAYPEFAHNANWATLAAGAATTPIEWNDGYDYGQFDDAQAEDMRRFITFVDTLPLVQIAPERLAVATSDPDVIGWGVGSGAGGVVWIQDVAGAAGSEAEQEDLDAMRARPPRAEVTVELTGLPPGPYTATPYDTWTGVYGAEIAFECATSCTFQAPPFTADVAFRLAPA